MGRQHIHVAALVHQFPYHIFFTICIFVTCIILSIVIHVWTLKIKYLPGTKSSAWMIPVCGPARSRQHVHAWFDLCAHNGITLNPKKFQFAQDTVDFAELSSTPTNVRPSTKLLDAMRDFPTPTDISGTRAWFGLVNQGANAFAMTQQMKPFAIY